MARNRIVGDAPLLNSPDLAPTQPETEQAPLWPSWIVAK
jgi:hypothetical protein